MNTLKYTLKLLLVVSVIVGSLYACNSFLTQPGQGTLDSNTLANKNGVEGSLIAAYSMLDGYAGYGGWGTAASNWIYGDVASDDAYKGSESGDNVAAHDVELYHWGSQAADAQMNDKWLVTYDAISRANATLKVLPNATDLSPEESDNIKGQALFLRAHYHFEAWKIWKNIPYYTEADKDFKKSNMGTDPIAKILADLDEAIKLLPETQSDVGKVTKWTAKAYKGRVQAYSHDYDGALATLTDVVNNGPYALDDNYYEVFSALNDNGPETVLAYQSSTNDGDPNGNNGDYPDRLNFPHSGSPFGCCGFHQPSQNLVNAYKVDANGLPLGLSDANWNNTNTYQDIDSTVAVDPRLDWTVGRPGVPFLDWGVYQVGWVRSFSYSGPYSDKKHIYEKESSAQSNVGWANYQLTSENVHLYRYADVMLLLAEAEVESSNGSLETARQLVNEVRARAAKVAQGPGTDLNSIAVPIDDPSTTWANYQIGLYPGPWTNKDYARKAVHLERRLELAMEGHRLFDLRRWGDAKTVINAYLSKEVTRRDYYNNTAQYTDKDNAYPIPSEQINLSIVNGKKMLQQNPGW